MADRVSFDARYRYLLNELAAKRGESAGLNQTDALQCMHQALTEYEADVERRLAKLESATGPQGIRHG